MLTQERQQTILELLERKRSVTVGELTGLLGASEATVRRDLSALAAAGRLQKVHGGATTLGSCVAAEEPDVPTKSALHVAEKQAIGAYAATLIQDDDFVFIDAGTTTEQLVRHLGPTQAVFVTNGIEHARLLLSRGLRTQLLGGAVKATTQAITGSVALENLGRYNFSKCFMGVNGVDIRRGLTTPDPEEAALKAAAMERAYLSFTLADASKFGVITPVTFSSLDRACIITEAAPAPEFCEQTIIKVVKEGQGQ